MADKLTEMYNKANVPPPDSNFQLFQRGVTAGAVSMRTRAMEAVRKLDHPALGDLDDVINAIGQLSDIP